MEKKVTINSEVSMDEIRQIQVNGRYLFKKAFPKDEIWEGKIKEISNKSILIQIGNGVSFWREKKSFFAENDIFEVL